MREPTEGFYFDGTNYKPCKLLAVYEFAGGTVRLLIGKSKVIMVKRADFVKVKPMSDFEMKQQAKRNERDAAKAQKEIQDANKKNEAA